MLVLLWLYPAAAGFVVITLSAGFAFVTRRGIH